MDENKLYAIFWKSLAVVLITLIIAITGSCQNTKYSLRKMVEAGADPMSAACALGGDGKPTSVQCVAHEFNKGN